MLQRVLKYALLLLRFHKLSLELDLKKTMAGEFDPYRMWLGIPPNEQPANHYRLLGIPLFEEDHDVIQNAADRQMAHVRNFQSGQHAHFSESILNELSIAKLCLLRADTKAEYDARLRTAPIARATPVEPPKPVLLQPPVASPPVATAQSVPVASLAEAPVESTKNASVTVRSRPTNNLARYRQRRKTLMVAFVLLMIAGIVVAILLAYALTKEESRQGRHRGSSTVSISCATHDTWPATARFFHESRRSVR